MSRKRIVSFKTKRRIREEERWVNEYKKIDCGYCKHSFFVEDDTKSTVICPYCANPITDI